MVRYEADFDTLNRLGVGRECDRQTHSRTDGQRDIYAPNAALNCVARPIASLLHR